MAEPNPLSLALDSGSEVAKAVKSIQIASIFFAIWIGALGWDLFYYFIWDIELVFSSGWSSPVRFLTRISYLLSRLLGFTSLLLSLIFWVEGWSENSCILLPFIYEGILVLSYGFTLIILALRTLSLYPGSSKFEQFVQCLTALGLVNVLIWGSVHVWKAGGQRLALTNTRCGYAEGHTGLFLIKGMLASTVIFNSIMFGLTCFKIYKSGSEQFFNRKTIVGKIFRSASSSSRDEKATAGNQLAASLITQGLIAFFYLLVVDIVALVCFLALSEDLYRQMTVICMAGFSSSLAGGLFRETYRASGLISRLMEAREEREKRDHSYRLQHEARNHHHEQTEEMGDWYDQRSQSRTTERSVAHPNWNSEVEVSSIENMAETDGESIVPRSSTDSKGYDSSTRTSTATFEQVPHLHQFVPTSNIPSTIEPNGPNEPHPFVPYSNPTRAPIFNQSSLMMGLSLHAFDDGASTSSTLGEVSILGAALPTRMNRNRGQGGMMGEDNIEMSRGPLPPPRKAGRRSPPSQPALKEMQRLTFLRASR